MKKIKNIIKDFFEFCFTFCCMILFLCNLKETVRFFKEEKDYQVKLGISIVYLTFVYTMICGIKIMVNCYKK